MGLAFFVASSCLLLGNSKPVYGFIGVGLNIETPTTHISSRIVSSSLSSSSSSSFSSISDGPEESESNRQEVVVNSEAMNLKTELLELADRTNRGFQASSTERKRAREIITALSRFNPTPEPASSYYKSNDSPGKQSTTAVPLTTLAGKWTLVYTDAPDITGLDTSRNPFSTAKLGRIGQECNPPYIKNVIEWMRPDWAKDLPFSGSDESRVLQKVVTSASAACDKPLIVNLKVAGLELDSGGDNNNNNVESSSEESSDLASRVNEIGLPAGLLSMYPVDLKGPWNPPFGQFEVMYLDDDLRMIQTGQNYVAVNKRLSTQEEWF